MFTYLRSLRRAVALGGSSLLLASAGALGTAVQPASAVVVQPAGSPAVATGGSGASLPYAEVQAENSATNGTVTGPSYTQGQLADEASYRKAVTLQGSGNSGISGAPYCGPWPTPPTP